MPQTAPTPTQAPGRDGASFLRAVRTGVEGWVRAAVEHATAELGSSSQRLAVAGGREHTSPVLTVLRNDRDDIIARVTAAVHVRLAEGEGGEREAAPAAAGLALRLIDEAQIDEEIETARIVQLIDAEAEAELQELNALCSNLRRLGHVDPKSAPLRPLVCAQSLRDGLAELPVERGTRLLLLRALGSAVGLQMRRVYAEQAALLTRWGVQPAVFRIRQTPAAAPLGSATRPADLDAAEPAPAAESMHKLVQWARAATPAPVVEANDSDSDGDFNLRLLLDPAVPSRSAAPLAQPAADQLMQRLFTQLAGQAEVSATARRLMQGLERTGRQLAAQDPALWASPEHPWWKLIDRLLALGAVHDDLGGRGAGALEQALDQVLARIPNDEHVDRQAVLAAADEVQAVASRLLDGETSQLLDQVGELQHAADREELEATLRNQIVQQLRSTPVCVELRRFLVGPWTMAMAGVAQRHGQDSGQLAEAALVVDDLIRATAQPGQRVSKAQRTVLLRHAAEGLALAGLPPARVDAEINDLTQVLRNPPALQDAAEAVWQEPEPDPQPAAHVLDLHAGLPTVPLAMGEDGRASDAAHDPALWVSSLEGGAYCRLFLQGQWMTAQLRWVSPSRNLFLFNSRHGGRSHSLTRRMLQKLRAAGLATSIEDGFLLAQAMDTLAHSTRV